MKIIAFIVFLIVIFFIFAIISKNTTQKFQQTPSKTLVKEQLASVSVTKRRPRVVKLPAKKPIRVERKLKNKNGSSLNKRRLLTAKN